MGTATINSAFFFFKNLIKHVKSKYANQEHIHESPYDGNSDNFHIGHDLRATRNRI